jgi:hypothetical protein
VSARSPTPVTTSKKRRRFDGRLLPFRDPWRPLHSQYRPIVSSAATLSPSTARLSTLAPAVCLVCSGARAGTCVVVRRGIRHSRPSLETTGAAESLLGPAAVGLGAGRGTLHLGRLATVSPTLPPPRMQRPCLDAPAAPAPTLSTMTARAEKPEPRTNRVEGSWPPELPAYAASVSPADTAHGRGRLCRHLVALMPTEPPSPEKNSARLPHGLASRFRRPCRGCTCRVDRPHGGSACLVPASRQPFRAVLATPLP